MPSLPVPIIRCFAAVSVLAALSITSGCSSSVASISLDPPSPAALSDDAQARVQTAVSEALHQSGSSAALVGVWVPGVGSLEQSYLAPGVDPAALPSTDSQFRLGQIGDLTACAVLLSVVEHGELALDDPVADTLSHESHIEGLTYRQLCQHTSGIADFVPELREATLRTPQRVWSDTELFATGQILTPLEQRTSFGSRQVLSQSNSVLLAKALRSVTGLSWSELLNKYLIAPLSLKSTSLPESSQVTLAATALPGFRLTPTDVGVECAAPIAVTEFSPTAYGSAGGLVSTLGDLRVLSTAYVAGKLNDDSLTPEIFRTAGPHFEGLSPAGDTIRLDPAQQAENDTQGIGLGVQRFANFWGQSSAIPGNATAVLVDPNTGISVAIVLNNSSAGRDFAFSTALRLATIATESYPEQSTPITWTEADAAARLTPLAICN